MRVYLADPDFVAESCAVKFTLTYEGSLKTSGRKQIQRKHEIRRALHPQLKRLWEVNWLLSTWHFKEGRPIDGRYVKATDRLKAKVEDFEFVPLVTESLCIECALELKVLRPTDKPGHVSDIDNQIKTLFDALKIPAVGEIKDGALVPTEKEKPFFVLVEDDRLVTKLSSINDELLAPVCGKDTIDPADVRVSIDVYLRPMLPTSDNVIFFSEDRQVWDHKYDEAIPENLAGLTTAQLRSLATQCIFRIRALASTYDQVRSTRHANWWNPTPSDADWQAEHNAERDEHARMDYLWRTELWPKAFAIKQELCRRIYGQGPYPEGDHRAGPAIDVGMLAGPSPLQDAALALDTLVRRLPG